jgi:hypothetical protein
MKYSCVYHASVFLTQLIASCHLHYFIYIPYLVLIDHDELIYTLSTLKNSIFCVIMPLYSDEEQPVFQMIVLHHLLISLFYFTLDSKQ